MRHGVSPEAHATGPGSPAPSGPTGGRRGGPTTTGPPPGLDKTYVLMSACAAALSKTPCFVRSGTV